MQTKPPPRKRYVVAMVLGTALSALGTSPVNSAQRGAPSSQAIQTISRYCTTCWQNAHLPPDRWGDCTQEVFRRLLERLSPTCWDRVLNEDSPERREFIRAIDAVKKRSQRDRKRWQQLPAALADSPEKNLQTHHEDCEALRQAIKTCLSDRQKRIVQMTWEGWSVPDIANCLSLSPQRISDEKYKAICKLRAKLIA